MLGPFLLLPATACYCLLRPERTMHTTTAQHSYTTAPLPHRTPHPTAPYTVQYSASRGTERCSVCVCVLLFLFLHVSSVSIMSSVYMLLDRDHVILWAVTKESARTSCNVVVVMARARTSDNVSLRQRHAQEHPATSSATSPRPLPPRALFARLLFISQDYSQCRT